MRLNPEFTKKLRFPPPPPKKKLWYNEFLALLSLCGVVLWREKPAGRMWIKSVEVEVCSRLFFMFLGLGLKLCLRLSKAEITGERSPSIL